MAYKCDVCRKAQPSGTQPTKLVTETRRKEYLQGGGGSFGVEIVKELSVCIPCTEVISSEAA